MMTLSQKITLVFELYQHVVNYFKRSDFFERVEDFLILRIDEGYQIKIPVTRIEQTWDNWTEKYVYGALKELYLFIPSLGYAYPTRYYINFSFNAVDYMIEYGFWMKYQEIEFTYPLEIKEVTTYYYLPSDYTIDLKYYWAPAPLQEIFKHRQASYKRNVTAYYPTITDIPSHLTDFYVFDSTMQSMTCLQYPYQYCFLPSFADYPEVKQRVHVWGEMLYSDYFFSCLGPGFLSQDFGADASFVNLVLSNHRHTYSSLIGFPIKTFWPFRGCYYQVVTEKGPSDYYYYYRRLYNIRHDGQFAVNPNLFSQTEVTDAQMPALGFYHLPNFPAFAGYNRCHIPAAGYTAVDITPFRNVNAIEFIDEFINYSPQEVRISAGRNCSVGDLGSEPVPCRLSKEGDVVFSKTYYGNVMTVSTSPFFTEGYGPRNKKGRTFLDNAPGYDEYRRIISDMYNDLSYYHCIVFKFKSLGISLYNLKECLSIIEQGPKPSLWNLNLFLSWHSLFNSLARDAIEEHILDIDNSYSTFYSCCYDFVSHIYEQHTADINEALYNTRGFIPWSAVSYILYDLWVCITDNGELIKALSQYRRTSAVDLVEAIVVNRLFVFAMGGNASRCSNTGTSATQLHGLFTSNLSPSYHLSSFNLVTSIIIDDCTFPGNNFLSFLNGKPSVSITVEGTPVSIPYKTSHVKTRTVNYYRSDNYESETSYENTYNYPLSIQQLAQIAKRPRF